MTKTTKQRRTAEWVLETIRTRLAEANQRLQDAEVNVKLSRARVVDIQAILASVEKASKAEAERTTDDA